MVKRNKKIRRLVGAAGCLAILLTLVVGVRAFAQGNVGKARRIAAQLQAAALANPNPIVESVLPSGSAPAQAASAAASPGRTSAAGSSATAGRAATAPAVPAALTAAGSQAASTAGGVARVAAPKIASHPASASTVAPMTKPTAAEVAEAISAVHSLVPFFTPTPDQIASAGNQVCVALNEGQSFAQVQSAALSMVGVGSYSWMIPSSDTEIAVQTLVALYCPANASKVTS